MKKQSALNAHEGGRKRKRGAFRFRQGAARFAPARMWGGVYIHVACLAFAQLELPNVLEPSAASLSRWAFCFGYIVLTR